MTISNCIHYMSCFAYIWINTCVLLVLNYFSDWLTGIPWSMESSAACSFSDNSRDDFMWAVSAAWFLSCTSLITAYHCRSLVGKNCWKEQQIFNNCQRICSVNRVVIRGVTHNMNWRKRNTFFSVSVSNTWSWMTSFQIMCDMLSTYKRYISYNQNSKVKYLSFNNNLGICLRTPFKNAIWRILKFVDNVLPLYMYIVELFLKIIWTFRD